jgi:hypothetical protein
MGRILQFYILMEDLISAAAFFLCSECDLDGKWGSMPFQTSVAEVNMEKMA